MAATQHHAASQRKLEEESSPEAADHKADETVARPAAAAAADVDEEDPVIRNLNAMSRLNLMTPEWIDNRKKEHYEDMAFYIRVHDALRNGEIKSDSEDDDGDEPLWASVDLSRLNTVGGESRGMDAVAVCPVCLHPPQEENDAAAAEESASKETDKCYCSTTSPL